MLPVMVTDHAAARLRQRGIVDDVATAALDYADREVELRDGLIALSLTRKAHRRLCSARGAALADRAKSLMLVIANGTLITVMHRQSNRASCYVRA